MNRIEFNQMIQSELEIHNSLKKTGLLDKAVFKRCGKGENVCNCKYESDCGYLEPHPTN